MDLDLPEEICDIICKHYISPIRCSSFLTIRKMILGYSEMIRKKLIKRGSSAVLELSADGESSSDESEDDDS